MDNLRVLPYSIKSEQEVVGAILKDNSKLLEAEELVPEDFYKESHKILFQAMQYLYKKGVGIDIGTLANILNARKRLDEVGGITYISEILSSSLCINFKDHVAIVKDKSNRRKIIKQCMAAMEKSYEEDNEIDEVINSFQNGMLDINTKKDEIITAAEMMSSTLSGVEVNYNNGGNIIGMKTGFQSIDNATDGIIKKDIVIIAARPSMGKTLFALNAIDSLSKSNNVLLFELEMNAEALGHRMLANKTKINGVRIRRGNLDNTQWDRIATQSNVLSSRNLFIDTGMNNTIMDIKRKAKKVKLQHGLDCIVIDHLGLIKPTNNKLNRQQQVAEISRECKQISKELDVSIILISQLNRGPEQRADHRPMLSDLREAGDIEQDADLVLFLYRDEYYNIETKEKGIMEVIIAKQRNGRTGTIKLNCDLETQTLSDLFR